MDYKITKEEAFRLYGNGYRLAKILGLTRSAVYQWRDGEYIPDDKALIIWHDLKPAMFKKRPPKKKWLERGDDGSSRQKKRD